MKLGSLFDGSGGFPLAGTLCGIEPVWASEIEPYPIAVTRSRFPNMKHLGNISNINGAEIEPVDIITFGSPCQDLSVAGKRAGLKHEANGDEETTRSGLFMEAVRIIKEMRDATNGSYPTFALWENVPGAFSSNKGEDFRTVLEELIKIVEPTAVVPDVPKNGWPYADSYLGYGWSLAYRVFDAQYWGVPQRRRRIHLVVDFRGGRARKVLFEREGVRGYFTESGTTWQGTAADAQGCAHADDREGAVVCKTYDARGNGDGDVVSTLTGDHENRITDYTSVICCIDGDKIGKAEREGGSGLGIRDGNTMYTLTAKDKHAVAYDTGNGQVDQAKLSEKVGALNCMHDQQCVLLGDHKPRYIVRRLTPTECARLQGFPDKWGYPNRKDAFTDEEYAFWTEVRCTHAIVNGKEPKTYSKEQMLNWYNKLHTDSAEYKMWGNGIALPPALYCMQGIAETLMEGFPRIGKTIEFGKITLKLKEEQEG